ncbi:EF-hand domain-containing protein [Lentzea sp. NPDC092896]|uniref:EF-hand domain-containing protein n=1 Tax=Lentzea sp. NPDC092896 TaxID=3364127 RepID=UPI00381A808E
MTQALLDRKWDNFFNHFDANGNGYIEHEDFVQRGQEVTAACGYDPASERAKSVADGFQQVWTSLAGSLDTDGDGRVSRGEFVAGMAVVAEGDSYDTIFQPAIDALLVIGDEDGDGKLSMNDWLRLQGGYGTPLTAAEESFRLLDTDASGYLTRAEISVATREYFTSTDPQAAGNNLYGPLV